MRPLALATALALALAAAVLPAHADAPGDDELADRVQAAYEQGHYAEAEANARLRLELRQADSGPRSAALASAYNDLAVLRLAQGDAALALDLLHHAVDALEGHHHDDPRQTATVLGNLAAVLQELGDLDGAQPLLEDALAAATDPEYADTRAGILYNLAALERERSHAERAEVLLDEAYVLLESVDPDHVRMPYVMAGLAAVRTQRGHPVEGLELLERALALVEDQWGADHPDAASMRAQLAGVLTVLGDERGAAELLERALPVLATTLGDDHPDTAVARGQLGVLRAHAGRADEAWGLLVDADLSLATALGPSHRERLQTLRGLADVARARGDADLALELALEAVRRSEQTVGAHHPDTARSRHVLGVVQLARRQMTDAIETLRVVVADLDASLGPDHPETATALHHLAGALSEIGDYAGGGAAYHRALAIRERAFGRDHVHVASTLIELGVCLRTRGDWDGARIALARAEQILVDDHREGSLLFAQLSDALATEATIDGDLDGAVSLFQRALDLRRAQLPPDDPMVGRSLSNLGGAMSTRGDLADARPLLEEALAIYGSRDTAEAIALHVGASNNLAVAMQRQGDIDAASAMMENTLARAVQALGPDHLDVATVSENLAAIEKAAGDLARADDLLADALRIREAALGAEHADVAHALHNLAALRATAGRLDEAEQLYARSYALRRRTLGPEHPSTAATLHAWAVTWARQGRLEAARDALLRALEARERALGPDHPDVADNLHQLAQVHHALGEDALARAELQRAVELTERAVAPMLEVSSERERIALLASRRAVLGHFLTRLDRDEDTTTAYDAVLRWKGAVRRSLLVEREAVLGADNASLTPILDALVVVRRDLAHLVHAPYDPDHADDRRGELTALSERRDALERDLARASASWSEGRRPLTATSAEVGAALPDGAVLIDVIRYGRVEQPFEPAVPAYAAFVLTGGTCGTPQRVELGRAEALDNAVRGWRAALADPDALSARVDGRAQAVVDGLWEPLRHVTDAATAIVWAPDGALATVSLAALPVGGGRYLIEDHTVVSVEHAADLVATPPANPGTGALLVGGVDYGESARGPCSSPAPPPLPGTDAEVRAIASRLGRALGRRHVATLTSTSATEPTVAAQAVGRQMLHLATHGFALPHGCGDAVGAEIPMAQSGLVLAPSTDDDGLWTAEEVAMLDLRGTRLVTLSACDSGLGTLTSGEGVLGLRRAFALAGAEALVMTLWSVPDDATQRLMADFYVQVMRGADPAYALRAVQLDALARARRTTAEGRPQAWGAFVASGPP